MKKCFSVVLVLMSAILTVTTTAVFATVGDSAKVENLIIKDSVTTAPHPLEPLLNAIIHVESKGDPKAYNKQGDCVGLLQITKICVRECNNVLKRKGSDKRYTYNDRWDGTKSIEMFYLLQEAYNPNNDIHKGIRIWNKRPSYKTKVLNIMKKMKY